MALPDYFKYEQGTYIAWGTTGAGGVTNILTLNNLASGSGRMGVYADLGATFEQEMLVSVWVETGTAPTAGTTVEVYFAWSPDAVNWPGKVTGADAAYPTVVADNKKQLGNPAIILIATNDTNTVLRQNYEVVVPKARYVAPVLINLLGQAIRNEGTPANNDSLVILYPKRSLIQETA